MTRRGCCLFLTMFVLSGIGYQQAHASTINETLIENETSMMSRLAPNLEQNVIRMAVIAYNKARHLGLTKKSILTIIDYDRPATKKRLWVFDLKKRRLFFKGLVAHGQNSGRITPTKFSNNMNSKESSLGVFLTGRTYYGHNGLSLNLIGLEKGINSNAKRRRIVIHGAKYVSQAFIRTYGYLGRSWGCPSLSKKAYIPVINEIKKGSIVFVYYPQRWWLNHSRYLQ